MPIESSYKESLFYLQDENENQYPNIQNVIEHLLSDNLAVGIIGGLYDKDNKISTRFISGFALNIMGYCKDDINNMHTNSFIDMIYEADKPFFLRWLKDDKDDFILRLKTKNNQHVWIKAKKLETYDKCDNKVWVISVRKLNEIFNRTLADENCIFLGVIDVECRTTTITKMAGNFLENNIFINPISYDKFLAATIDKFVSAENKEDVERDLSLENIKNNLLECGYYENTALRVINKNKTIFIRNKYSYLTDAKRFILVIVENITPFFIFDPVAKCLNYKGFLLKTEEYIKNNSEDMLILAFNICGFKAINDTFGYYAGNKFLSRFADVLKKASFKPRFVSRGDSDYFLCIIEKKNFDVENLKKFCKQEFDLMGTHLLIYLQCGIFEITKDNIKIYDIRQMCCFARTAQQKLSNNYSNPISIYTSTMTDEYILNTEIVSSLYKAIDEEQFQIYYQPIFNSKTQEIAAAEALVRWQHPQYGFWAPDLFISVLESHGLVFHLDKYVIEKVNKFLSERLKNNKSIVPISSNISRADLLHYDALDEILKTIENSVVPNEYHRLEVTETIFKNIDKKMINKLMELDKNGIKIFIDDFGSGYSSFSSMATFPLYVTKLDMSLCKMIGENKNAEIIIKNMIDLCHSLGGKVVAEGIETKKQYEILRNFDCDYIQGFYFARPMPEKSFEAFLDK